MNQLQKTFLVIILCIGLLLTSSFTSTASLSQTPVAYPVLSMVIMEVDDEAAAVHQDGCEHSGKIIYSTKVQAENPVSKNEIDNIAESLAISFTNPEMLLLESEQCPGSLTGYHVISFNNRVGYFHLRNDATTCITFERKLYECDYCDYMYFSGNINEKTHQYGSYSCLTYPAPL